MIDEKYIMTGIIGMLLVAAWQKPSLYKEHLSNKVMFVFGACWLLFAAWDLSLEVAVSNIPKSIGEDALKIVSDGVNKSSIPTSWWIFIVLMYFGSYLLDWLAEISLKHEKTA